MNLEEFSSGKRLRILRKKIGYSQQKLAEKLGFEEKTIRRWEKKEISYQGLPLVLQFFRTRFSYCNINRLLLDTNLGESTFWQELDQAGQPTEAFYQKVEIELKRLEKRKAFDSLHPNFQIDSKTEKKTIDFLLSTYAKTFLFDFTFTAGVLCCSKNHQITDIIAQVEILRYYSKIKIFFIITETQGDRELIEKIARKDQINVFLLSEIEKLNDYFSEVESQKKEIMQERLITKVEKALTEKWDQRGNWEMFSVFLTSESSLGAFFCQLFSSAMKTPLDDLINPVRSILEEEGVDLKPIREQIIF